MNDDQARDKNESPAGAGAGGEGSPPGGPVGRGESDARKALEEAGRALREAAEKTGVAAREMGREVSAGTEEALADLRGAARMATERAREATADALGRARERVDPRGSGTGGSSASGSGGASAGTPATAPGAGNGRSGSGTGIDANLAAALAYVGWAITGILFYVIEPEDRFVRFHALQSILLTAAAFIIAVVLAVVPFIGPFLSSLAMFGFVLVWLFAMWKALRHEEYRLPFIGAIAHAQVHRQG